MPKNVRLRTGNGVFIRDPDNAERFADTRLQQNGRTSFTESSMGQVFLDRNDSAAFTPRAQDSLDREHLLKAHAWALPVSA